ncbi:MAG: T9SS type A sorting domain-containing protein [Bacteroidota bacterium]
MRIKIRFTKLSFFNAGALLWFLLQALCYGQWSTSTSTSNALFVCPGYYSGILTFNDGSSIILGALSGYIYAQKLDPKGYKMWSQPVMVFHNNNSAIGTSAYPPFWQWGDWVSDDDGGIIIFWYDYRDAYNTSTDFMNNALYIQHVDKNGIIKWDSSGILVRGVETGLKSAAIVRDGSGGCILTWSESGFNYPGAPNVDHIVSSRWSNNGQKLWERIIDSSATKGIIGLSSLNRAGHKIYTNIIHNSNPVTIISTVEGLSDSLVFYYEKSSNYSWKDSILYRIRALSDVYLLKIGFLGDTIWSTKIILPQNCQPFSNFRNSPYFPDDHGGFYYLYICDNDTIHHFDENGNFYQTYFKNITKFGGYYFHDGKNGIVNSSDNCDAQRYDEMGTSLWDTSFVYLQDSFNAYFKRYESDNNGGIITSFWTTTGGIYAQHTGRHGRVGIITGITNSFLQPSGYSLSQNFPNPFNPITTIEYRLPTQSRVMVSIYNSLGQMIQNLVDEMVGPGTHFVKWDASRFASGVYYYRIITKDFAQTKKLILIK